MAWDSKGFQVRKNKGVENSPPKTRRPRKTFILERIITPSALVPGGVDDRDALHQLLNSLSLLSFDFSDWAEKLNHATNLHLFADSGAGTCPTSPTPDGDLPPIVDFDPLGLHSPPTPTPGPNIQGAFDTLPPPIILPVDPPGSNNKVPTDLGGAYTFTGKTASGNNDAVQANQYTFSIASSELNSTDSDTVLVGISVESKDGSQGLPQLPEVGGLTPILTSSDTNSTYSLFSINRSGLNLLNLNGASSSSSGAYSLQLNVAGDINSDGRVDATDRQLLDNALGRTASDPGYTIDLDLNRDGIINSADQTLLNSNFGFIANRPPVASPFSTSTHTELETVIPLVGKATDPERDSIFYNALNPVNGTVLFDSNTKTATFKPAPGFSGIASFELAASDGLNWGVPAKVTVNVSGAPLLNLDFAQRRPQLNAGESTQLTVLGDFADQKGVVLPASYLTYASLNPGVAPIDAFGKVTGLADGTSILSASRNNIQAVTAARVGKMPIAANDDESNALLAEIYGLDVYPQAVTLTKGINRSLLVGIEGVTDSPDLKFGSVGTRYFVSNPNVLQVNSDGVITALGEGVASVTVIDGAAEKVVPVRVKTPLMGPAILGVDGGVVQGSDGSTVMVAPGALTQDTTVSITSLSRESLSLPIPAGFEFAGAFNLDFSGDKMNQPAQLAIPAPEGLAVGTKVYFMRKGAIPDETGTPNSMWLQEESGIVGSDGFIRTQSPPYPGIVRPGEYIVAYGNPANSGILVKGQLAYDFPVVFLGIMDPFGNIGQVLEPYGFSASPAFTVFHDISSVKVIAFPKQGLPKVTELKVEPNGKGGATFGGPLTQANSGTGGSGGDVWPPEGMGSYWFSYNGSLKKTSQERRAMFQNILKTPSIKKVYLNVLSAFGATFKPTDQINAGDGPWGSGIYSMQSNIVNMISSLQGQDIFTEFKEERDKYDKANPNNPSPIEVVGWFEGTGISRLGSTLYETAAKAKYKKSGAENYSAVLKKQTDGVQTLDLLHEDVHNKLKNIVYDFLTKHGPLVSSIIFDDRYGIFEDAVSEIAARHDIPNDYKDGQAGWIRDRLTDNLKDIKNTAFLLGTELSISSHKFSWAKDKNNQDLERWLKEGIINGEYNFQLYKNGTHYESFKEEYDTNMKTAKGYLRQNGLGKIPSLSVSLGYTAGVDEKGDRVLLSKEDIQKQIKYILAEKPKDFPVLNSENIFGFDYGNLVTKEPPDTTPKVV